VVHGNEQAKDVTRQIAANARKLNAQTDIESFIKHWLFVNGPPQPPEAMLYGLPCTIDELKAGQFESNPNSVFRCSLRALMERQKGEKELALLVVPEIVPRLINEVVQRQGLVTEGIFRISASKQEIEALQLQIDTSSDYTLPGDSPHIPASLLKIWLRLLPEPLIATEVYEEAIRLMKDTENPPRERLVAIFDKCDTTAQAVMRKIANLCSIITKPENMAKNRMNVENLAIVFGPSFFRNPSEDPMELIANVKYETKFTALLLSALM
jgi:hypothetical protein